MQCENSDVVAPAATSIPADKWAINITEDVTRKTLISLIRDSVITLCNGGLVDGYVERVEGLIGITLKSHEVLLVNIGEHLGNTKDSCCSPTVQDCSPEKVQDSCHKSYKNKELTVDIEAAERLSMSPCQTLENQLTNIRYGNPEMNQRSSITASHLEAINDPTSCVMNIVKQQQSLSTKHETNFVNRNSCIDMATGNLESQFIKQEPMVSDNELSGAEDFDNHRELDFSSGGGLPLSKHSHNNRKSASSMSSLGCSTMSPLDSMSHMLSQQPSGSSWYPSKSCPSRQSQFHEIGMSDVDFHSKVGDRSSGPRMTSVMNWNMCASESDVKNCPINNVCKTASDYSDMVLPHTEDGGFAQLCLDTEGRPYMCRLCNMSFSKKFCLANHIVTIHQVGGKYVCATCGKQFLQRMRYMTHVDRHQNVRRHICTTCGKAFTYKYSLWSHAKKCNGLIGASIDPAVDHVSFSDDFDNTTFAVG